MALSIQTLVFAGILLLLLLTALAGYSYSQIRILSLPIHDAFALMTVLLPFVTGVSTYMAYRLLRARASKPQLNIKIIAISVCQIIYETIIATLSVIYMAPNCGLEEQWKRLYSNRDGDAIKKIQDRFDCCGFNSLIDRAYPFPYGRPNEGHGADQCKNITGRRGSCVGPWTRAEQTNAGIFFTVALSIFLIKAAILIFQLNNSWTHSLNWIRHFKRLTTGDLEGGEQANFATTRLIDEGEEPITQGTYHDEHESGHEHAGTAGTENANSGQPRVQPSGLTGGEQWR